MGQKCCTPEYDEYAGVKSSKGGKSSNMQKNIAGQTDRDSESLPQANQPNDDAGDVDDYGATENILQPGTKISINDFQLLTVVGRGSFGKVYLVKKKDNGQPYAMKILKKDQLIKKNLLIKTQAERDILEKIKNPYIVGLHFAFQTEGKLYFLIDFLNGGELFTYLRKEQKFHETRAKLYAAEIVCAIEALHQQNIIYRDLKPENVLLDAQGHIRITDFGLSKQGVKQTDKTHSFCGTPEYLAPEIIKGSGHSWGADWWSLGALLYEMLCGRPPHYNKDRQQMLRDITEKPIPMKHYFSPEATSLLQQLLERDPTKRIGAENDAVDLKRHSFFMDIDWDAVSRKEHEMPFKPRVRGPEDTSCIDKLFTKEGLAETQVDPNALTTHQKKQAHFDGFTYAGKNPLKR